MEISDGLDFRKLIKKSLARPLTLKSFIAEQSIKISIKVILGPHSSKKYASD